MNMIIHQIIQEYITKVSEYFSEEEIHSIDEAETKLTKVTHEYISQMLGAYYEQIDEQIYADKKARKAEGLTVHKRSVERSLTTIFGDVSFKRTYYKNNKTEEYEYPIDKAANICSYERVSCGLGLKLCEASLDMSYQKACKYVAKGNVTRQTVMNKIRDSEAEHIYTEPKKEIKVLHIDADEDHVTLRNGKKCEVPLISIYEGIEENGKRHRCKNVFHISEYGKKPDELWEQVLTEIESRYEITDKTKIYIHGDGANWIKSGFEWFANSRFVLDKYHKNKYIKEMLAGFDDELKEVYNNEIRYALDEADISHLHQMTQSMIAKQPERSEKILNCARYFENNIYGISICSIDQEANNGGCTEPHVSHVLSSRLSSRPLAWSGQTLKQFAPMLARRSNIKRIKKPGLQANALLTKAARAASKAFVSKAANPGSPNPNAIGLIPGISCGKVTPLYNAVHHIL